MNLYELLEVKPTDEASVIKQSYLRLVKTYHPDVNPGFERIFIAIHEAYQVLGDPAKRAWYDHSSTLADKQREQQFRSKRTRTRTLRFSMRGLKADRVTRYKSYLLKSDVVAALYLAADFYYPDDPRISDAFETVADMIERLDI